MTFAETILVNGRVFLEENARPADSVAIRSGRILHIGQGRLPELTGPRTTIIDMMGGSLLPGFQDAHVHPLEAGVNSLTCDLSREQHTIAHYHRALHRYARAHPTDEWIVGNGWYGDTFPGGFPTRHDLDTVIADRPAALTSHDGHGVWVNTRALELAGITESTPDPEGGRIDRDDRGEASGVLFESAAELVTRLIEPPTTDFLIRALLAAQQRLHSVGVTAWQDAAVGAQLFGVPDNYPIYRAVEAAGGLTARVVGAQWWFPDRGLGQLADLRERREECSVGRFRPTAVKVMQDGICENCTGAMLNPYCTETAADTGMSFLEPAELREVAGALAGEDFQIHMHAVGDRAVRECLDALETGIRRHPRSRGRHQIAHLDVVHPDDIPRFAELGVIANIQALWARRDTEIVERKLPLLGPAREKWHFPFRALSDAGARLAMGSDWPVTDPNPLWAIHTAITRTGPRDDPHAVGPDAHTVPLEPDQTLDLRTAIHACTQGSAYANHLDHETGSIQVGKKADLVLLNRDILTAEDVSTLRPVLTMVDGDPVYRAN